LLIQNPTLSAIVSGVYSGAIPGLSAFYTTRTPNNFIATEGYCDYTTPTGFLGPRTTTSMLNTPYFVNAIQNGVANSKINDPYPYVQSAYLFLNSLPLASLREKYKSITDGSTLTDLDYIVIENLLISSLANKASNKDFIAVNKFIWQTPEKFKIISRIIHLSLLYNVYFKF
jgi:hypothetical protein